MTDSQQVENVRDIHGNLLPLERQLDWQYARSLGLRPSEIRFMNGEPMAVWADGSGIYGPCPSREEQP